MWLRSGSAQTNRQSRGDTLYQLSPTENTILILYRSLCRARSDQYLPALSPGRTDDIRQLDHLAPFLLLAQASSNARKDERPGRLLTLLAYWHLDATEP